MSQVSVNFTNLVMLQEVNMQVQTNQRNQAEHNVQDHEDLIPRSELNRGRSSAGIPHSVFDGSLGWTRRSIPTSWPLP